MKRSIGPLWATLGIGLLSGCGGGGGAVAALGDLLGLDGAEVVGVSRAVSTQQQEVSKTFPDRTIGGRPGGRWQLRHACGRAVQVSVPDGATLPESFTLTNIAFRLRVSDGDRVAERTASVAGPVVFTRQGTSDLFRSDSELALEWTFTEGSAETFRQIVTTAPSPNAATASVQYDADDARLPAGSMVRFGLQRGQARRY